MKPQVNQKGRKKSPSQHKTYGEKRNRDILKLFREDWRNA